MWLIGRYAATAGIATRPISDRLWHTGVEHGFDGAGFCIDAVGIDFVPLRSSRRIWPQCEAARAALIRPGRDGEAVLAVALRRLNADFLDRPFPAGWVDRLDQKGAITINFVPASSLHHLYGTWAQLAERQRMDADAPLRDDP